MQHDRSQSRGRYVAQAHHPMQSDCQISVCTSLYLCVHYTKQKTGANFLKMSHRFKGNSMNPIIGHMENACVTFDKKWDYPGYSMAKLIDGKVVIDGVVCNDVGDPCSRVTLSGPDWPVVDHDNGDRHATVKTEYQLTYRDGIVVSISRSNPDCPITDHQSPITTQAMNTPPNHASQTRCQRVRIDSLATLLHLA